MASTQTAYANQNKENFTIVVLPDTQHYSEVYPFIFENQTKWIVQNKDELNIVFVAHLGDLVQNTNNEQEWQRADNAMSILDNKVTYGLLPGNHDISTRGDAPYYEKYFPTTRYENYSYWGGCYDAVSVSSSFPNMNNCQLFSAGGMDFIAINLQYSPPADVLNWADEILNEYPNRRAIISTHGYLNIDGTRMGMGTRIWDNLIKKHDKVFLLLCGHNHGEARRSDNNLENQTDYQLLSDYQDYTSGGNGYLRIMKFAPSESTIYVQTYSPYLDNYMTGSDSQFELYYSMNSTPSTSGGIPLVVYVGTIVVIVVIIAVVLYTRK
jgi:3',5'-cyclic AMP phosphodiesterase CpdA